LIAHINILYTYVYISKLKINQNIYITFIPHSQKYLDILLPKKGKIISIQKNIYYNEYLERSEFNYDIKIQNENGLVEKLLHDSVSYFGNSLGYEYTIYLID